MKNYFILFVTVFLLSLTFQSCQKETIYSCDPTINEWAKNNKTQISRFNRNDISKFDIVHQQVILRVLTPEKRREIWLEKINYIKNLKWDLSEKTYIDFLVKSYNSIDYSFSNMKYNNDLDKLMYNKIEEATKKFNWDHYKVFELFFTIGDLGSYNYDNVSRPAPQDEPICHCRYSISCAWAYEHCERDACEQTYGGCGVFGGADCLGVCE